MLQSTDHSLAGQPIIRIGPVRRQGQNLCASARATRYWPPLM
jgi:hypothetical protein